MFVVDSKDTQVSALEPVTITEKGRKDFGNVIKLRIL